MEPNQEGIVTLLKGSPAQLLSFKQLIRELELDSSDRQELRQLLHLMVKDGTLIKLKGSRYALPAKRSVIVGKLSTHRDGYGFVIPDKKEGDLEGDVFIPARFMGDAMEGDTVLANVEKIKEGRRAEGKILKVLQRRNLRIVGQFKKSTPYNFVIPYDSKIDQEILVRQGDEKDAPAESIVNVEITQFSGDRRRLRGQVVEVLGFRGDFGVDVEIIIRKNQIPIDFPQAVLGQVKSINREVSPDEWEERMDFRASPIVTIDGETARDFDDAVHVEKLESGSYLLGVHIADVAHYVKKDSPLDQEAFRRGTSVYFPNRAVPMLPEELSNGICSLNPQVDRLTLSVLMEIDPTGDVQHYSFHEGVIHSHERMTYTSVGKILDDKDPGLCSRHHRLVPQFELMRELALLLYEKRRKRGSIDFDLPEPVISFDEFGSMIGILKSERNIADRIIEEFMITANETVARHLFQRDVPSLYRIHELPDAQKVFEFDEIALSFGYRLGIGSGERAVGKPPRIKDRLQRGRRRRTDRSEAMAVQGADFKIHSRDYQRLIDQIAGKPEERILSYLMLRSLKQAIYSPQNKGHFGLASRCYTHFTSPIRRYPDLIVHRILKALLNSGEVEHPGYKPALPTQQKLLFSFQEEGQDPENLESRKVRKKTRHSKRESFAEAAPVGNPSLYENEGLDAVARHSSETERRADDSERELIELKKLEFMADKLGDEFEGIVIHIIKEGMFVELLDLFVEGFVNINSLGDDDYRFRDRPICLAGRRSGNSFRLGDRLIVAVDRIDRFRRRVDLSVARKVLPNNSPL